MRLADEDRGRVQLAQHLGIAVAPLGAVGNVLLDLADDGGRIGPGVVRVKADRVRQPRVVGQQPQEAAADQQRLAPVLLQLRHKGLDVLLGQRMRALVDFVVHVHVHDQLRGGASS